MCWTFTNSMDSSNKRESEKGVSEIYIKLKFVFNFGWRPVVAILLTNFHFGGASLQTEVPERQIEMTLFRVLTVCLSLVSREQTFVVKNLPQNFEKKMFLKLHLLPAALLLDGLGRIFKPFQTISPTGNDFSFFLNLSDTCVTKAVK